MTNRLDLSQTPAERLKHVFSQHDEAYSSLKAELKALGTDAAASEGRMRHPDITLAVLLITSADSTGNALRRSGLERIEAGKFIPMALGTVDKAPTDVMEELLS
jgi:hypothetical protein